jgi:hypothetical protein
MGFFSDIKDDMDWNAMRRLGIRLTENRMECCEMCQHFEYSNESCTAHNVIVNKSGWICGHYGR